MATTFACVNPDCPSDGSTDSSVVATQFQICSVCGVQMNASVTPNPEPVPESEPEVSGWTLFDKAVVHPEVVKEPVTVAGSGAKVPPGQVKKA